jgi:hypothetical protein
MRTRSKVVLGVSLAAGFGVLCVIGPGPAGASTYQSFGNLKYGDCAYEAMANLELHEFPGLKITTNEVVRAWREGDKQGFNVIPYMMSTGFDGKTIGAITNGSLTSKSQIIQAVANGGAWATISDSSHAVAIIGADRRFITIVDDGIIEHWSWGTFKYWQGSPNLVYPIVWEGGTGTN